MNGTAGPSSSTSPRRTAAMSVAKTLNVKKTAKLRSQRPWHELLLFVAVVAFASRSAVSALLLDAGVETLLAALDAFVLTFALAGAFVYALFHGNSKGALRDAGVRASLGTTAAGVAAAVVTDATSGSVVATKRLSAAAHSSPYLASANNGAIGGDDDDDDDEEEEDFGALRRARLTLPAVGSSLKSNGLRSRPSVTSPTSADGSVLRAADLSAVRSGGGSSATTTSRRRRRGRRGRSPASNQRSTPGATAAAAAPSPKLAPPTQALYRSSQRSLAADAGSGRGIAGEGVGGINSGQGLMGGIGGGVAGRGRTAMSAAAVTRRLLSLPGPPALHFMQQTRAAQVGHFSLS